MKDPAEFLVAIFLNLMMVGILEFFYSIQVSANEEAREKNNDANQYVWGGMLLILFMMTSVSIALWESTYSFKTGLLIETVIWLVLLVGNGILTAILRRPAPLVSAVISLVACLILGVMVYFYCKDDVKNYIANVHWSSTKQGKLEQKLAELEALSDKLKTKKDDAIKLKADYDQQIVKLEQEILQEKKANRISSFSEANRNPRISYDLALIQKLKAYITKLEEMEEKLTNGVYEMEFLQRSTEADLKMVKTFDEKEIAELADKINKVITKYLPDAGELVVNIDQAKLEKPQKIWEEINKKK